MREVSKEMAIYLYLSSDNPVYLLYPDGTEAVVEEFVDLDNHGFIFGVEDNE